MNTIITKQKLAIAKLLPEKICFQNFNVKGKIVPLFQHGKEWDIDNNTIEETEWLQIIQWVEEGLNEVEFRAFDEALHKQSMDEKDPLRAYTSATVSQRLAALKAAGIIKL